MLLAGSLILGLITGAAVALALTRRLMSAAFFLLLVLLGVAVLFGWSEAMFAASAQVVLYVGGILILIIFGLMLTQKDTPEQPDTAWAFPLLGFAAAAGTGFFFLNWAQVVGKTVPALTPISSPERIGVHLLTSYLIPFELLSLLLLVALVGAIQVARTEK